MSLNITRLPFSDLHVTAEDIRNAPWAPVLRSGDITNIEDFNAPLTELAKAELDAGHFTNASAITLLAGACSMYLDLSDLNEPLKPLIRMNGRRSVALEDFTDEHLDPIKQVLPEIENLEVKARLADLLWIKHKDLESALVAAESYLKLAAEKIDPRHWVVPFNRLKRAIQIAASLGKDSEIRSKAFEFCYQLLDTLKDVDTMYLTSSIIKLLLDYKENPSGLALFAVSCAQSAETSGDWMRAAEYHDLAARCYGRAGNAALQKEQRGLEGEAYLTLARNLTGEARTACTHWLKRGYAALKQSSASVVKLATVEREIREGQAKDLDQLDPVEINIPIRQELLDHLNSVRGLSSDRALVFWARQAEPVSRAKLKGYLDIQREAGPMLSLVSMELLSGDGRTEAVLDPIGLDSDPDELHLDQHLWHVATSLQMMPAAFCEYVRKIIVSEHTWRDDLFNGLLVNNLWVPPGREDIFRRGLKAAFEGDFLICTHLLIPQVENSVRNAVAERDGGPSVWKLNNDGTQEVRSLNDALKKAVELGLLNEDFAFGFRALLCEKSGSNLRNKVAHGLLSESEFSGHPSVLFGPTVVLFLIQGLSPV